MYFVIFLLLTNIFLFVACMYAMDKKICKLELTIEETERLVFDARQKISVCELENEKMSRHLCQLLKKSVTHEYVDGMNKSFDSKIINLGENISKEITNINNKIDGKNKKKQ